LTHYVSEDVDVRFGRASHRKFLPFLLSIAAFVCLPSISQATLTVTSVTTNLNQYSATLNWTPDAGPFTIDALGCGAAAPVLSLTCTPWMAVQFQALAFPGFGQVALSLQHLTGPHAIDINPGVAGGLLVENVFPGIGSGSASVNTPHTPHYDHIVLDVQAISAGLSRITITAEHLQVPEPGSLALAALGGSALLLARRLRCRKS
jgi:hypothetical protein